MTRLIIYEYDAAQETERNPLTPEDQLAIINYFAWNRSRKWVSDKLGLHHSAIKRFTAQPGIQREIELRKQEIRDLLWSTNV